MTTTKKKQPPTRSGPRTTRAAESLRRVELDDRAAWRAWLEAHQHDVDGVWLVTRKASRGGALTIDDIVEEALCFGWIDSLPRKLDDDRTMLLVSPRKPKSNWSRVNKTRVARLQDAGLMARRGQEVVDAAKASGAWDALADVDALVVPDDLVQAFARHEGAAANFDAFPPSTRRGILEWIINAKRPETRAARVDETARLAAENVRANQWRKA